MLIALALPPGGASRRRAVGVTVPGVDDSERRAFAVRTVAAGDLAWADPAEDDGRRVLIEAEHPELAGALSSDLHEVLVGDQVVNAALHVSLHEIVATQLWNDDPAEVWLTAVRLTSLAYEHHDVLHMLMQVVGEDVRRALSGEAIRDQSAMSRALAELPASWERGRPAPAANRAERRAAARRRRSRRGRAG